MKTRTMATFSDWFEQQHGKREKNRPDISDEELEDEVNRGQAAAAELHRRNAWDARRESALYAWQAKGR